MRSPCIQKIGSVTGCSVSRCRPHQTSFAFTDPFSRRWACQRHTHLLFCSFPRDEQQQEDSRAHIGAIHNNGLFHLFCFTGKFTVFSGSSAQQLRHIQDFSVARCAHIATCKAAARSSKTMTKYRSSSAEAPSAMIFFVIAPDIRPSLKRRQLQLSPGKKAPHKEAPDNTVTIRYIIASSTKLRMNNNATMAMIGWISFASFLKILMMQ